jgi:hypothetical protein
LLPPPLIVKIAIDVMGTSPSTEPPRTVLNYGLSIKKIDAVLTVVRDIIKWGALVLITRYAYHSISDLAGHQTYADIGVQFLGNLKISESLLYLLTGGSIIYGMGERRLRRKHIGRVVPLKNELEKKLNPSRTSSNLTKEGTTRRGDEQ